MEGLELISRFFSGLADTASTLDARGAGLWILTGVFLLSGFLKLRSPGRAAMAMADFGVVRRPTRKLGILLGAAEMGLACALLTATVRNGELALLVVGGAALLLWTFTGLILRSLLADEQFECFCFGDSGSKLSRWTALRTGALALLATGVSALSAAMGHVSVPLGSVVLQGMIGLGTLSLLALISQARDFITWNRDPFGVRPPDWLRE